MQQQRRDLAVGLSCSHVDLQEKWWRFIFQGKLPREPPPRSAVSCLASPRPAPPRFSAEAPRAAAACAGPGFVLKPEKGSARKASFQPINLGREGEEGWRYVLLE